MKPMGAIPPWFIAGANGQLVLGGRNVEALSRATLP
jgi:hypothetical protein